MNIRQLALSGELLKLAGGCQTWGQVAKRLGVNTKTLHSALERMRIRGETYPSIEEIAAVDGNSKATLNSSSVVVDDADVDIDVSEWDEEQTRPEVPLPAIPQGFRVDRISTLIDSETGDQKLQWLKVARDAAVDPVEVLRAAFGDAQPLAPLIDPPAYVHDDLLALYGIGDPHIGMLAWEAETGENFDLAIAERQIVGAVDNLVARVPAARDALVVTVGDTLHSDGLKNSTTKGTPVDVDGRTPKMIATAIRTFRRVIERALERHHDVYVKIARGNHDEMMSVVLAIALAQFYENNPRVHIDTSPAYWHWHVFGANFVGITHGHRQKPIDMMAVMASLHPTEWAATRHRRIICGHYHHEMTKEVPGVVVDYLPTLAAKEAYAAAHGYIAGRSMRADVLHRTRGLVERHMVSVEMLEAA